MQQNKENLQFFEKRIIKIEDMFQEQSKITLSEKKLELFLNGVKLSSNLNDGICRVYNDKDEFIGIGEVSERKIKRDIVVL